MGINDINSLSHTKWNCKYHIVFAPKYRRKIFYGLLFMTSPQHIRDPDRGQKRQEQKNHDHYPMTHSICHGYKMAWNIESIRYLAFIMFLQDHRHIFAFIKISRSFFKRDFPFRRSLSKTEAVST